MAVPGDAGVPLFNLSNTAVSHMPCLQGFIPLIYLILGRFYRIIRKCVPYYVNGIPKEVLGR